MFLTYTSSVTKYQLAWIALPVMAIFNGVLRELTYSQMFGDRLAHQISAILLSTMIVVFVISLNARIRLATPAEAWRVGLTWLLLTISFEFMLGLILGTPFGEQLQQYDIARGNLWALVPITVLFAPVVLRLFPRTR